MAIRVRKKSKSMLDLTDTEKYRSIKLYLKHQNCAPAADKFGVKLHSMRKFISKLTDNLVNVKATVCLMDERNVKWGIYHSNKESDINKKYLSLLSPEDGGLTENEKQFAYLLVETLDAQFAAEESGLGVGLSNGKGSNLDTKGIYRRNLTLRAKQLQSKQNVKEFIEVLREQKVKDITKNINPERLQMEMLELFEASKASGDRKSAISLLKQLGDSVGMYVKNVKVEQKVSPGETLDSLLEMAKEADIKELN